MGTFIVGAVVLAAAGAAVRVIWRDKKSGRCCGGCSCGCQDGCCGCGDREEKGK